MDHTTVIIPARNEEAAIGGVVGAFTMHPENDYDVHVAIDRETTDGTARLATEWGATPWQVRVHGKGEVVAEMVRILQVHAKLSDRIILCDGDYKGLAFGHINDLVKYDAGVTIGVPDWPDCEVPNHVINAWPLASGFRYLPHELVPVDAHGYLLETQVNLAAIRGRMPIRQVFMTGLKSPFQWPLSPRRMAALELDRQWGRRNGVFPNTEGIGK